jgi:MAF protein
MRPPLILASGSPRRRQLLKQAGIPFKVTPSRVSEDSREPNPRKRAEALALRKAKAVAERRSSGWVLGADTIVVLGNQMLGKPANADDAYRMLYRLAGSTHRVVTGVALVDSANGRSLVASAVSHVTMKKIEIDALLVLSRKHLDKAGAYAIQEKRDPIARVTKGSYDNVVGLPVDLVKEMLKRFGAASRRPSSKPRPGGRRPRRSALGRNS